MFDLNQEIERWKNTFAVKKACSKDELDELESHLREEIEEQINSGSTQPEAFKEAVARLGESSFICDEFSKNDKRFLLDSVAIRGSSVGAALLGLGAVTIGCLIVSKKGDGLLAIHVATLFFGFVVSFLAGIVGTYAIARSAVVKDSGNNFQQRLTIHSRILFGCITVGCLLGLILGCFWAQQNLDGFWTWDPKEIGTLIPTFCAVGLLGYFLKFNPSAVRLGQGGLIISLVAFLAWIGPTMLTLESIAAPGFIIFVLILFFHLAILSISVVAPRCKMIKS